MSVNDLLNHLQNTLNSLDSDYNQVCQDVASNPHRHILNDILLERKQMLRGTLCIGSSLDNEEPSEKIDDIILDLDNPSFPLSSEGVDKDEEWLNLEKKYYEQLKNIKQELIIREQELMKDNSKAVDAMLHALRMQMIYRPIDERDRQLARDSVNKRFMSARISLRSDIASKVLVLRREIEQQGRKRRNFDKETTEILQKWFNEHRESPYPSEEQKNELAKQCGIKLSQVNNWFGNQRIRSKQQLKQMQNEQQQRQRQQQQMGMEDPTSSTSQDYSNQYGGFDEQQQHHQDYMSMPGPSNSDYQPNYYMDYNPNYDEPHDDSYQMCNNSMNY
ncbi:unnamed protein product [Caenorhabditis bovis]|uniref:Homeobox domain-containing protein n=1 Tax=Caenorhabditis bovis TaxID=2654633 RepID=A0A8S1EHV7_9PELO|nr:unnamed protein product [Caenorhabditis bovis]